MPLQEIECMGAQLDVALQVCLEHEGVGALGGGKGPSAVPFELFAIRLVQKFSTRLIGVSNRDQNSAGSQAL